MRKILHFDLDAFFCSVEELLDPSLKGRAFVVGGSPQGRGVVTSASYAARAFGVRSAMPMTRALRLCPDLISVRGSHRLYGEYSDKVMTLLRQSAPVVEQISIDEAFLDVSDDPRSPDEIALELQARIREQFGLPTSWGAATNKLVAKVATEVGKPNGLVVVPPGQEAQFLAPLPVEMLWGVGPKARAQLLDLDVRTIGDLAALPASRLERDYGERGTELAARAKGQDDSPVVEGHEPRSMSSERTFPKDVADWPSLRRHLREMSDSVGRRLRREGMAGSTVRLKLRWPDFTTITRQSRLPQPSDVDGEIFQAAAELLRANWKEGRKVRLLGVGVSDLGPLTRQLSLFDRTWQQDERLLQAMDAIRARYGPEALQRGHRLRGHGRAFEE
jgi:DNA polymerase-4